MPRPLVTATLAVLIGALGVHAAREATIERLRAADKEPENWLVYGATYRSLRYSPLDQINRSNVRRLEAAWRTPEAILEAMTTGAMRENAKGLSDAQQRIVAEVLAARPPRRAGAAGAPIRPTRGINPRRPRACPPKRFRR